MKTTFRATFRALAFAAALIATPAAAADLYGRRPGPAYAAAPFSGYNWNGVYVGANLGYQWGKVTNWGPTEPSGIMGGGQIGYNWQFGTVGARPRGRHPGLGRERHLRGATSSPIRGSARVRGRAGYAMNNVLVYVTGGLAYGGGTVDFGPASESQTHLGWTIGAGVEVGLTPNWSAKAEYLYVRLEDRGYVLTGVNNGFQSNVFRLGVNYRF